MTNANVAAQLTNPQWVEAALLEGLRRQTDLYNELFPIVELAHNAFQSGRDAHDQIQTMNEKIAEIESSELEVAPFKTAWASFGQRSADLNTAKMELQIAIKKSLEKTTVIEKLIQSAMDSLSPKMNQQIVKSKMFRAYTAQ